MSRLVSVLLAFVLLLPALAACRPVAAPAPSAGTAASGTRAPAVPPAPTPTPRPPTATATPRPTVASADAGRATLVLEPTGGEQVTVRAELARTPEQRAQGLMFRDSVAEGEGMLFLFPADTTTGFWMKNTKVPLSIAFIAADGVIVGLDDMQPLSEETHSPPRPYRYALEVPQGFFARHRIKVGDKVLARSGEALLPLGRLPDGS